MGKKKEQHSMTRSVILKRGDFVTQRMYGKSGNFSSFLSFFVYYKCVCVCVCVCVYVHARVHARMFLLLTSNG